MFLSSHDPDPASRFFFSAAAFAFLASSGPTGGRFLWPIRPYLRRAWWRAWWRGDERGG